MNKPKLISLKDAIVSAFKNLFENASLGFAYKGFLTMLAISIALSIPSFITQGIGFIGNISSFLDGQNLNQNIRIEQSYEQDFYNTGTNLQIDSNTEPTNKMDIAPAVMIILGIVGAGLGILNSAISSALSFLVPIKIHNRDLVPIKELVKEAFVKGLRFLALNLVVGLITGLGFILFIIPGIIFAIWFLFAPYILLTEDTGIFEAMKGSKALTKNYRWNLLGRFISMIIIILVLSIPLLIIFILSFGAVFPLLIIGLPVMSYLLSMILLKFYKDLKEKQGTGNTEENPTPEPTDNVELGTMPEKEEPKEKSKKKKKEKKVKKEKKKKNKSKPKDENPNIPSLTSVNLEENPEVKGSSGEDLPEPENLPEPSKPSTKQVETENSDFIEPVEDAITGEEKSPEVKENTAEKTPDLNIPTTDASLKEEPKMETPKPEEASTDTTKEAQETPQENTGPELNIPDELPEDLQSEPKVESTETKEEAPESTEQQPETSEEQA